MNVKKRKFLVLSILLLLSVITLAGYFYFVYVSPTEQTFSGTIKKVEKCSNWLGGASCTWVVDDNAVTWKVSSTPTPHNPSTITGMDRGQTDIGKAVRVHAHRTGYKQYELTSSSDYIVSQ